MSPPDAADARVWFLLEAANWEHFFEVLTNADEPLLVEAMRALQRVQSYQSPHDISVLREAIGSILSQSAEGWALRNEARFAAEQAEADECIDEEIRAEVSPWDN